MVLEKVQLRNLHSTVLSWFGTSTRNIWWRKDKQDPWITLVTEIMSQQTQMERVAVASKNFLELYPTPDDLAKASNADVIRAWQGMGYNSRAVRLRDCARAIVEAGALPSDYDKLIRLPGVGPYTAAAICSFSFGQNLAVVDVNVERVLSRIFEKQEYTDQRLNKRTLQDLALEIVPAGQSRAWHQAIMDIGATYCKARATNCVDCPISQCLSRNNLTYRKQTKKAEPLFFGRPRRLWRGDIVNILRREHDVSSLSLAEELDLDDADGTTFLYETLHQLEKDGLVQHRVLQDSTVLYSLHDK